MREGSSIGPCQCDNGTVPMVRYDGSENHASHSFASSGGATSLSGSPFFTFSAPQRSVAIRLDTTYVAWPAAGYVNGNRITAVSLPARERRSHTGGHVSWLRGVGNVSRRCHRRSYHRRIGRAGFDLGLRRRRW